jgi:hypothetical protein
MARRGGREVGSLLDNPCRRRWWLLTKALEGASLQEALEFALAADVFTVGGANGLSPEDQALAEIASTEVENRYLH